MNSNKLRNVRRNRRKRGIRKKLFGTPQCPRLTVFRSAKNIYAQVIDDVEGKTIAAAGSTTIDKGWNVDAASQVGQLIAEKAKSAGVEEVVFDRNGFRFHGRIKALADGAREGGLKF